ncbi:alcohol dehydrogenase catalytic domain-containing protein [Dietzia sp. ANT_WB102]|uniref:alcohol dehydrogenase catalytic domain-containing protein n=1 Tax=Dietzia sp. ANT_WB102 TaxID=2597345 RepID=UPI0011F09354|nr:alcohol dehydrogenase catalytic domain-containing protein [Dietzia sp. ANT_WB102]KAA0918922.1 zinc-binding dehydrogenase [Dietzia sp. ANT_WB102]
MRAVVFEGYKTFPVLTDVDKPSPGPGEVLLKVAGSGACHSDVGLFHDFPADPTGFLTPPFTLGHEVSGWIEEVGPGVSGFTPGEAFLVYGPIGCGRCKPCSRGQDTYCQNVASVGYMATGLGRDGGMAEYMTTYARNLIPLGDADPIAAAPLADAGLTPYHAIKRALPHLTAPGATALCIGLGGLGLVGVQIIRALTGATVYATDTKPDAIASAEADGAIGIPSKGAAETITELTGGQGVNAVFDFVGAATTLELAAASVAQQGSLTVVGLAGGDFAWNAFRLPYEVNFSSTYWGTIEDLHEVVELYRAGKISPAVSVYPLGQALDVYQNLVDGAVSGRAVIAPHGT